MRSAIARLSLCLALTCAVHAALAQQRAVAVRGRVVAADDGRPLRRALVTLASSGGVRPVLTDDEGRFELQPPDPSASLTITKAGYASTTFEPPRRTVAPTPEIEIRLARGGIISGRIIDSSGEGAVGVKVIARLDGAAQSIPAFGAEADDQGDYRIAGLPAGRYTVSTQAAGLRVLSAGDFERMQALAKQGRGFVDLLRAQGGPSRSVDVRSGEETGGTDFEVPASETTRGLSQRSREMTMTVPATVVAASGTNTPGPSEAVIIGAPQPDLGGGRVVHIIENGIPRSMDLMLSGGGAITGTIVDSAGEPFQGITVRALQVRRENGRMVARAFGWARVTDDRGRYRLFGLPAGSYLLVASLDATEFAGEGRPAMGLAPVFFPGSAHVDAAQTLQVELARDVTGIDLTFAASPTVRLTGTALNAAGQPLLGRVLLGISQRSGAIAPDPRSVRTAADGTFEFSDVPPGDYVVQALGDPFPGTVAEFGAEYVTIAERNAPPLKVTTSPGATLEGRFVVEGMSEPPMRAFSLHAAPLDTDQSPPGGRGPAGLGIHDDGRFYLTGLFGPMRLSAPNSMPGWYLKSATIGGVDVTDVSFDFGSETSVIADAEIVLSNTGAAIAGSMVDGSGSRAPVFTAVAFSTSSRQWFDGSRHVKRVSSGPNGSFDINGLPPGDYFVAAVDPARSVDWQSPEALQSLVPQATRVTAREGAVSTVTLRLIGR